MFILINELAVQMKNVNFMILMIMYFYHIFVLIYFIKLIKTFSFMFQNKMSLLLVCNSYGCNTSA